MTIFKKSPLAFAKSTLTTGVNVIGRVGKTASVAGLSALRVAKGETPDAHLLKETFEKLGVTYIKLGQFIASTPSLFPKEYVIAFADCLDNTTPVSFFAIKRVLDEELAHLGGVDGVFAHIDPMPLASASIAQVHKATLKTGQIVALKVQKPHVDTIIHTDLSVLHGGFWTLEKLIPSAKFANLAPIMQEIKSRMMAETDFVLERQHLAKFRQFVDKNGLTHITAPKVYDNLSTKKVLVMEFLDGVSLVDETAIKTLVETNPHIVFPQPQEIMANVLDTWFLSLVQTGEFHADLHTGNLMLTTLGKIAFLDFGLVGEINPNAIASCMNLVQALQQNNFEGMAQAMVGIGMTKDKVDTKRLAEDLQAFLGQGANLGANNELNALMAHLTDIGKRHGIRFPKDFALLAKQLLYFDRFMLTLAPEMDLFGDNRAKIIELGR